MPASSKPIPPGFVVFEANWLNKVRNPIQSIFPCRGYEVLISNSADTFLKTLSPYQKITLSQKLYSFAGNPRAESEIRHKKNTTDKYYVPEKNTGFSISYEIIDGRIFVTTIVPDINASGIHKEVPGCYHVRMALIDNQEEWVIDRQKRNMEVSTDFAAVNGQSNDLNRAVGLMAVHVKHAYGKNLQEYTLFHNPSDGGMWDTYESSLDKKGETTGVTKTFSGVLNNIQSQEKKVNWIAHSQGGVIFTEAVRYHVQNMGGSLDKNGVTFHAGANDLEKTKSYLPLAGIKVLGYNDHPFDLVPQLVGKHHNGKISNIVGAVLHAGYVLNGTAEKSPHTLPYDGMDNYVDQMPRWYKVMYKIFN